MEDATALRLAMELVHMPSRARALRAAAVPAGVLLVLEIAAGDETATTRAIVLTDRPRDVVRNAAAFFIEQILLYPDADSYRVLGAGRSATAVELRRNMAMLLRWLHPDMSLLAERSLFAGRVTQAWEDLKTPERRAAYDAGERAIAAEKAANAGSTPARSGSRTATSSTRSNALAHSNGPSLARPARRSRRFAIVPEPLRHADGASQQTLLSRVFRFLIGPPRH